jgi:hypothetical protein
MRWLLAFAFGLSGCAEAGDRGLELARAEVK